MLGTAYEGAVGRRKSAIGNAALAMPVLTKIVPNTIDARVRYSIPLGLDL